jgi:hypothetical protein
MVMKGRDTMADFLCQATKTKQREQSAFKARQLPIWASHLATKRQIP